MYSRIKQIKIRPTFDISSGIAFIFSMGLVNDASTIGRKLGDWEFWFVAEFINVRIGLTIDF